MKDSGTGEPSPAGSIERDLPDTGVSSGALDHPADPVELVRQLVATEHSAFLRFFPHSAVFAFDQDLRYMSAGGAALDGLGLSRRLLEGRTIFEVLSSEACQAVEPSYRAALRGEQTGVDVPHEGRIYSQRLTPVRDREGQVVAALGFSQDVTDSRLADRARQESEMRMRLTIDNAPIGQALVDLDGRWRAVNPALIALLGYPEARLMELTFQDITHPDDLDLDLELLHRLIAGEIPSYEMEKRYLTASGALVWVLLSVSLVRDGDGAPLYFISQIVDISGRKAQEEALRDLTAMLAHDLRTPATVIAGFAEVMTSNWDHHSDEERLHAFRRIESAARAMRVLLDNSLTASALDGHGLQPDPARIDLTSVVQDVLAAVPHPDLQVKSQGLEGIQVWIDGHHLAQVLANLITNTVKYGGDRLHLSARHRGERVLLTVADNGPGVPPSFVPQMFDRFSRAESARADKQHGSGLGLYIVRDLLELNGAKITYSSTATGEAAFVLDLPCPPL